ncbi:MAG: nuclear transport factor 2 family protein [Sphingomonadales bacterium]|nr:nuclear transport factor 2 family protein [Sphingomonadales bacterium]
MSEIEELRAELALLKAERDIQRLQVAYGYYVDKAQWDEAADLFARDATLEIAARGQFRGQDRIRAYLHALPPLEHGTVFNHMQLQPLITVASDGQSAKGRWRAIMEVGFLGREELCGEATYENAYVKEDGVWKIARLHAFVTYFVRWNEGWSAGGVPMGTALPQMMPDAPQTVAYGSYPDVYIPPYHYPNPVTGKAWRKERDA